MRDKQLALLMSRGMPARDAETALTAYELTPTGDPYSADAVRVAVILNSGGTPCS